jgi:hypothetical protein
MKPEFIISLGGALYFFAGMVWMELTKRKT